MSQHRFYLPPEAWLAASPQLNEADTHHCANVLRMEAGDQIIVFDGCGSEAVATIKVFHKSGGHHAELVMGSRSTTPRSRCQVTLAQAVPKARNMDLIIQKAVELGAARIVPLLSDRTIIRCPDEKDVLHKQERWQSIAVEACKQSGQNWLPIVERPCQPKDFFPIVNKNHFLLIASLQPDARSIKETISEASIAYGDLPSNVTVMIGPEGDFTPAESAQAKSFGFQPIHLGPIILRTETAALYCLSVLAHELSLGDRS